jgi:16S rRNA (guanine527-N7)-methyltransferase
MTSGEFRERLLARVSRAGATVPATSLDALEAYFVLLARWNPKVNLTALPLDPPRDETFDRLFVEPIVAAEHLLPISALQSSPPPVWFDFGSGGGSPAVPLKILRPHWRLTMVEARERKAAFLREVVRAVPLLDADVASARFEELTGSAAGVDLLTVRAVRIDADLAATADRLLSSAGTLALFGSAAAALPGFSLRETVPLNQPSVLTLMSRVPRGT